MPELTVTSPYVDSNTCNMDNPISESTLTRCQSRLYPSVEEKNLTSDDVCWRAEQIKQRRHQRAGSSLNLLIRRIFTDNFATVFFQRAIVDDKRQLLQTFLQLFSHYIVITIIHVWQGLAAY